MNIEKLLIEMIYRERCAYGEHKKKFKCVNCGCDNVSYIDDEDEYYIRCPQCGFTVDIINENLRSDVK